MFKEFFILFFIIFFNQIPDSYAAACSQITSQSTCSSTSGCWWQSGACACSSNVTMDICFALDASSSIGQSSFTTELDWLANLIGTGLTNDARVGIIRFATISQYLLNFTQSDAYSTTQLESFVESIYYTGGWTNTVAAIEQAIAMFDAESDAQRSKVLVIITDGNPNLPNGGDVDVCALASTLKADEITTLIVGVGSQWDPDNVDCLVSSSDDIVYVTSFTTSDFDSVLPQVTAITCPVDYSLKITEIKVISENSTNTAPFVEIYNPSTTITLGDISVSGLFTGTLGTSSQTLSQAQYLVLYDGDRGNVTCSDCGCTLMGNNMYCEDSIYVKCYTGGTCYWSGATSSNTDFIVTFTDASSGTVIESVEYDSSWPSLLTGYSFELKELGYDDTAGSNWQSSCNIYGTPGSAPITSCATPCTQEQCRANGASSAYCHNSTCVCNDNSYYADGLNCYVVPPPGTCYSYWLKNGSFHYARFIWEAANTDVNHQYKLRYYACNDGACEVDTSISYSRVKAVADFDFTRLWNQTAGWVQTVIEDSVYTSYSTSVNCTVITSAPTPAPSFDNPRVYIAGDICEYDRCSCSDASWECTGPSIYKQYAPSSEEQFITIKRWPADFPYGTTVWWSIKYVGATNSSGSNSTARRLGAIKFILASVNGSNVTSNSTAPTTTVNTASSTIIQPLSGYVTFNGSSETKVSILISNTLAAQASDFLMFEFQINSNCTSQQEACYAVYPTQFYLLIDTSSGSSLNSHTTEKNIPDWLWWLIAGLVLLLFLLALLVYRYWYKNKQTGYQLQHTQEELEREIENNDLGFGRDLAVGDVVYNPMATGVPGYSRPADPMGTELKNRQNADNQERADVQVEKFNHKEQFGQIFQSKRKGDENNLTERLLNS